MSKRGIGVSLASYTIGITGHRYLPPDHIPSLKSKIQRFYQEIISRHKAENITVLSPLADGADNLCAKLALDAGLRLVVPLPMNALDYRESFSGITAVEFDCLLSLADQVFVVQPEEVIPPNPQQGFHFRQAGIYVVKHCDILLAVWDGIEQDTPDGAGTWETVKLAREHGKPVFHIAI